MANKKIQYIYDSFTKIEDVSKALTEETKDRLAKVEEEKSSEYKSIGTQLQKNSEAFLTCLQNIFKKFYNNITTKETSYFQDKRAYMVWDYISRSIEKKYQEVAATATSNQKARLQEIAKGIKNNNDTKARETAREIKEEGETSIQEVGEEIFSILSKQYQRRTELYNNMVKVLQQGKIDDVLTLVKNHGAAIGATSRAHEKGQEDLLDKKAFFQCCLWYQEKLNKMMNQKQVTVFVTLDIKNRTIQIFQIPESKIPDYVSIEASSDEKQLIFKYSIGQIKAAARVNNDLISISQTISIGTGKTISEEIVNALNNRQVNGQMYDHLKKTINAYLNEKYKMTSAGIGAQAFIKYLLSEQHIGLGALIHEVDNVSGLLQGDIDLGEMQLAIKSKNASSLSIPQLIETAKVIIKINPPDNIIRFLFFLKDALNASSTLINKKEYREGNEDVDKAILEEIDQEMKMLIKRFSKKQTRKLLR